MSDVTRVYWKRREDSKEGDYVSGFCKPEDIPSCGDIRHLPLPRDIVVTTAEDGTIRAISPPVIGARHAYRYHLHLTPQRRANIATESDLSLDMMLNVMMTDAPVGGASRENWWWYASDRFTTLRYGKKTPVTLMKKWKRAMLEILLETHPQKEEKLLEWDHRVAAHNTYVAKRTKSKTSAHKKKDGDLVVLPRPVNFTSDQVKQIFRYEIQDAPLGGRAKHSLKIHSTRYRIPHGPAMTFADGTTPGDDLSLPIRTAMCLLAWSNSPMNSAHAILGATQRFEAMAEDLICQLENITAPREGVDQFASLYDYAAAISALTNFRPRRVMDEATPIQVNVYKQINETIDRALKVLHSGKSLIAPPEM